MIANGKKVTVKDLRIFKIGILMKVITIMMELTAVINIDAIVAIEIPDNPLFLNI